MAKIFKSVTTESVAEGYEQRELPNTTSAIYELVKLL